jgi:uncharacterized membrane protein YeaQ/YmgE (transglycosylase-associated protein family)
MTTAPSKPLSPIILFVQWLLFGSFGWFSGLGLGAWLTPRLAQTLGGGEDSLLAYVTLLVLGLTLGVSQALMLRSLLPESPRWVRATLGGFILALVGMALLSALRLSGEGLLDDALLLAVLGALVALPQWRLLRQRFAHAWLWIIASALGWLSFLFLAAAPASESYEFIVRGFLYGTLSLLPTGLLLLWFHYTWQKTPPAPAKGKRK